MVCMRGKAKGVGRMSEDAGEFPEFVVKTLMTPNQGAKDAACTRSLCSIRSGLTNCINFPCPLESGPSSLFWASQPLEPAEWLALLILKAGDVESNPGPKNRKLPPSALTTQTTTHSHATTSHPNQKLLALLQLNINSITNKHEELKLLVTELQLDIITIQGTKLKKHNKTPQIPTYSAIRTDRANGKGGGGRWSLICCKR